MNPTIKRVAERAIAHSGVLPLLRRRRRHNAIVLGYHNVVPRGIPQVGDRSLHLAQDAFAAQLDALTATHDVVPLTSLAEPGHAERPRVAITFDDAYEGALTVAVDELAKRQLPATIFVTPALLGLETWWDVIASPSAGAVPPSMRDHALTTLKGDRDAVLRWARHSDLDTDSRSSGPRLGTEAQLRRAASRSGIAIASHTWSHKNLSALEGDELEHELVAPRRWLEERFAGVLPWLTYPYGLYSAATERAVERAGYAGAFRVDGGWMSSTSDRRYALPRLNVPAGMSIDGFKMRLAGLGADR